MLVKLLLQTCFLSSLLAPSYATKLDSVVSAHTGSVSKSKGNTTSTLDDVQDRAKGHINKPGLLRKPPIPDIVAKPIQANNHTGPFPVEIITVVNASILLSATPTDSQWRIKSTACSSQDYRVRLHNGNCTIFVWTKVGYPLHGG